MKALTICQPYAEMIALGEKVIENRTWPTIYRGPLLIHAGKSKNWLEADDKAEYPEMVFGAIVARAELYDCVRVQDLLAAYKDDPHANGPWCWLLRNVERLPQPIPHKGALGLWEFDTSTRAWDEPFEMP